MSKKLAEEFVAKYRPIAEQVGKDIGVDPNIILSQWALESAYGKKIPASNNIAGIQDFSGSGKAARDPQTGKTGKYVEFEDPETFGMYYADMIKRQFPYAVNTGEDVGAFTRGLVAGKSGSYFEADPQRYATGLASFYNTLPGTEKIEPPVITQFEGVEAAKAGAPQAAAPSAPKPETDEQRDARMRREQEEAANEVERRQAQLLGGGLGAGISSLRGAKGVIGSLAETAGQRAETGRQAAMAAAQSAAARGAAPVVKTGAPSPATVSTAAAGVEPTSAQTTRILQGTTGDAGTTGRARMSGFAAETSQTAAAQKRAYELADQLRKMGIVTEDAPTFFAKQSGFTSSPSGVLIPRAEPPQTLGPRGPLGQIGGGRPAPIPDISGLTKTAPALDIYQPPAAPSSTAGQKIKSGLDTVTGLFKSMMRPVGVVAKYAAPPLTLAGAAGEGVNIAQEMRKPSSERDLTSLGLSGLNLLGTGMSFFPPTMPVGIPLSIGAAAAQEYRKNPEFRKYVDEKLTGGEASGGLPVVP